MGGEGVLLSPGCRECMLVLCERVRRVPGLLARTPAALQQVPSLGYASGSANGLANAFCINIIKTNGCAVPTTGLISLPPPLPNAPQSGPSACTSSRWGSSALGRTWPTCSTGWTRNGLQGGGVQGACLGQQAARGWVGWGAVGSEGHGVGVRVVHTLHHESSAPQWALG